MDSKMNERIEKLLDQIQINEQIERLAKQAGCSIDRMGYGEGNLEKFAELIVRKCAQIGEDVDGNQTTKNEILKHFGVEE
jgi:hypothetical protein